MAFWDNVETLRLAQNTSYRWIAKKMGVSETTVSSMRKTGTEPRASDAFKIAAALGTTVEYLCNGESDYYQSRYTNLKNAIKEVLKMY
ncbi:helix-turn-helix transcriptional regulator [uncultured Treponema sp.]|uniref:helix-turn-helix domain-containing protein n=1 Tax=uncultured Treponema sp. TaxID=162155 RepID=UPI0025FA19D3|nr:helix-turn-helix transcriptional regulator [uncultured Treponema sp.]